MAAAEAGHAFRLLDVFAERKHQGNQLLVLVDQAAALDDAQLLAITREINFAESAFICGSDPDGAVRVRIFTPEYEVPFAGHPTLGLAFVAASLGLAAADGSLTLRLNPRLGGGDVGVTRGDDGVWWMLQPPPKFIDPLPVGQLAGLVPNWEAVVDATRLTDGALVPEVSTGLPYLLIPVKDAAALAAVELPQGGEAKLEEIGRSKTTHPLQLHSYSTSTTALARRPGGWTRTAVVAAAARSGSARACSASSKACGWRTRPQAARPGASRRSSRSTALRSCRRRSSRACRWGGPRRCRSTARRQGRARARACGRSG